MMEKRMVQKYYTENADMEQTLWNSETNILNINVQLECCYI